MKKFCTLFSVFLFITVFNSSAQTTYYWISGSTNWAVGSFSTSATLPRTASVQEPAATDNVIFDALSGTNVSVALPAAKTIANLTVSTGGTVSFTASFNLTITSSITFSNATKLAATPATNGFGFSLGNGGTFTLNGHDAANCFSYNANGYLLFNTTSSLTIFSDPSLTVTTSWGALSPNRGLITLGNNFNVQRLTFGSNAGNVVQGVIVGENNTLTISGNGSCSFNSQTNCQGVDVSANGAKLIVTSQNATILGNQTTFAPITGRLFKSSTVVNYLEFNRSAATFCLPQAISVNNLVLTLGTINNTTNNITLTNGGTITRVAGTLTAPTFESNISVTYNNTAALTTNFELPSTVKNLTVSGTNAVTLNVPLTITDSLNLISNILNVATDKNITFNNGSTPVNIVRTAGQIAGTSLVFTSQVNVTINGTSNLTSGFELPFSNSRLNNLTINSSAAYNLGASRTVNGILTIQNGTLSTGSNTLRLDTTTASAIIQPTGILSINGGTVDLNNRPVTFKSSNSSTATLSSVTGTLLDASNVTVERYIPGGSRRFRFLSHPFTSARPINILSGLSYTGAGGTGNGFTHTTGTNNPSVFSFTTANADGASNDAGWTAITDATAANWGVGQGIRLLVRGTFGEGLDGNTYTPSATTISMTETINTGNVNVPLVLGGSGGSANFNLVGNPYPSAVNIEDIITANTNVNKTIYLRNPSSGSYITKDLTLGANADYSIPSNAGFFVVPTAATNLTFTEANKVNTPTTDVVFTEKAKDPTAYIELQTLVGTEVYDNMYVKFDKRWSNKFESKVDATKAVNDFVNVYALSEDGKRLSVDARPFTHESMIPLGVRLNNGSRTLSIKASTVNIDETAYEVVLLDKLTNIKTVLTKEAEYSFIVNMSDATTYGDERLVLLLNRKATATANPVDVATTSFGAKLQSTVISNKIAINLQNATGKTSIRVVNALGQTMVTREASNIGTGTVEIISDKLGKGLYYIQVENGNSKQTLTASKL